LSETSSCVRDIGTDAGNGPVSPAFAASSARSFDGRAATVAGNAVHSCVTHTSSGSANVCGNAPESNNQPYVAQARSCLTGQEPILHTWQAACKYVATTDGQHLQLWKGGREPMRPVSSLSLQCTTWQCLQGMDGCKLLLMTLESVVRVWPIPHTQIRMPKYAWHGSHNQECLIMVHHGTSWYSLLAPDIKCAKTVRHPGEHAA
jgi:hypothetical protein